MEKHVFLQGKLVYLRALEEKDLSGNYFQWLNDEEVCRYNSHAIFPNSESGMKAFLDSQHRSKDRVVLAIVDIQTDLHIGNISLQNIDWISRTAEYAILMGDKKYWGKGYSTEASLMMCVYGFIKLNLHRIYCGTSEANIGMQKLAAKMKMVKEGIRRKAFFKNGEYKDIFEYGVLKEEFFSGNEIL